MKTPEQPNIGVSWAKRSLPRLKRRQMDFFSKLFGSKEFEDLQDAGIMVITLYLKTTEIRQLFRGFVGRKLAMSQLAERGLRCIFSKQKRRTGTCNSTYPPTPFSARCEDLEVMYIMPRLPPYCDVGIDKRSFRGLTPERLGLPRC